LHELELDRSEIEIIVVDNASRDGTADAAATLADVVLRRTSNAGSCAKAWGVDVARGTYIVFLDDDSFPRRGSISRMVSYFEDDPHLGAVGFTIHLPNGRRESSALPGVGVGCGIGFRTAALRDAGGLDRTFFMQAEEYDLTFRLAAAGWVARVFDDLHVDHLKTPVARRSDRITYFDIRNNLRVIARHMPQPWAAEYRADWTQRYAWLAERDGHMDAFRSGRRDGTWRAALERWTHATRRLSPDGFESFFRLAELAGRFRTLRDQGVRRITGADLGKNIYAYFRAAQLAGIHITAIGDDRFAQSQRLYRGIPVVSLTNALESPGDAVVVMNMAPSHADETRRRVLGLTSTPVYDWYGEAAEKHISGPPEAVSAIGNRIDYPCQVTPLSVR